MKKIKGKLLALAAASAPVALFAEGEPTNTPDMSAATTAFTNMTTAVTGWINAVAPYLGTFLAGVLVVSLIWIGFKWVTRGAKKA